MKFIYAKGQRNQDILNMTIKIKQIIKIMCVNIWNYNILHLIHII